MLVPTERKDDVVAAAAAGRLRCLRVDAPCVLVRAWWPRFEDVAPDIAVPAFVLAGER